MSNGSGRSARAKIIFPIAGTAVGPSEPPQHALIAHSLLLGSVACAAFPWCAHGISTRFSFFVFFGECFAWAGHILPFWQHAISSHAGALHAASMEITNTQTWSEANIRRIVRA